MSLPATTGAGETGSPSLDFQSADHDKLTDKLNSGNHYKLTFDRKQSLQQETDLHTYLLLSICMRIKKVLKQLLPSSATCKHLLKRRVESLASLSIPCTQSVASAPENEINLSSSESGTHFILQTDQI